MMILAQAKNLYNLNERIIFVKQIEFLYVQLASLKRLQAPTLSHGHVLCNVLPPATYFCIDELHDFGTRLGLAQMHSTLEMCNLVIMQFRRLDQQPVLPG
jgi:hypothetical protein